MMLDLKSKSIDELNDTLCARCIASLELALDRGVNTMLCQQCNAVIAEMLERLHAQETRHYN